MSYNPQNPNGQATSANSAPVVVASDQSALPIAGNVAAGAADSGNPVKVAGKFNSSAPTLADGQRGDLQLDTNGNLKVNIASGGSTSATQYAEGASAATATGTLAMGKNGTTLKATQTDTSGNLRVDLSQTSANATAIKVDGSGVTQPVNTTQIAGAAIATAASGIQKIGLTDGSGTAITSTSSALDVNIKSGSAATAATVDEATWTAGTSNFAPTGGVFNDSAAALTSGQQGTARMTSNRGLHTNLRNSSGTELATASNPLQVSLANTATNATAIKVDGSGVTQPVSGTVGLATGTNSIGNVGLNAGSNNIGGVELIDSGGTNKLAVNASGQAAVLATGGDLTSGNQLTKVTDGTNTLNVGIGDASNGFALAGSGRLTQTFSLSTTGASTAFDVGNYRWVSVQFTSVGASGASTAFQSSNDNSNFANTSLVSSGAVGVNAVTAATASAGVGIYHGPLTGRYFRLNVTALPSGTVAGTIIFMTQPGALAAYGVAVSQQSSPWVSSLQPATSGGWSISSQTALTNTVVSAKASAGQVGGHMFYNPNNAVSYIQVFNLATGSVTLGTTTPTLVIPLPPAAAANIEWANGIAFGTAISFAATTTATGNTAPTTALTGFLLFK
jgi:hypothetical protein